MLGRSTPALPKLRMGSAAPPSVTPQKMTFMEMTRMKAPDYMQECDTAQVVRVKLVASDPRSVPQVISLKSGETIQNIKKKILSTKGVSFGYRDFELLYQDRPVIDPLSLQDVPGLTTDPHPVLKVVLKNRAPLFLPPLESSVGGSEIEVMQVHTPTTGTAIPSPSSPKATTFSGKNKSPAMEPRQSPSLTDDSEEEIHRPSSISMKPPIPNESFASSEESDGIWSSTDGDEKDDDGDGEGYGSSSSSTSDSLLSEGCVEVRVEDEDFEEEEEEEEEGEEEEEAAGAGTGTAASVVEDEDEESSGTSSRFTARDDSDSTNPSTQRGSSGFNTARARLTGASTADMYKKDSPVSSAQTAFHPSGGGVSPRLIYQQQQQQQQPSQQSMQQTRLMQKPSFFSLQSGRKFAGDDGTGYQMYGDTPPVQPNRRLPFSSEDRHLDTAAHKIQMMALDRDGRSTGVESVDYGEEDEDGMVSIEVESDLDSYGTPSSVNQITMDSPLSGRDHMTTPQQQQQQPPLPGQVQSRQRGQPVPPLHLPSHPNIPSRQHQLQQHPPPLQQHQAQYLQVSPSDYTDSRESMPDLSQPLGFVPMLNALMRTYVGERSQNMQRLHNLMETAEILQKQVETSHDELALDEVRELSSRVGKERSGVRSGESAQRELTIVQQEIVSSREAMNNLARRLRDLEARTNSLEQLITSRDEQITRLKHENSEFQQRIASVQQLMSTF